uniref:ATP synthase complex subunit 8 n=1 Tax=Puri aleca TaxID=2900204 RepID=A0A8K1WDS7_9NEOP|nr:ATP synthase F0 subunit 8 [Puri aleca]
MPQMSPLNWLMLFLFFSMIFFIFNMMNYFITIYSTPSNKKTNFKSNSLNWKW